MRSLVYLILTTGVVCAAPTTALKPFFAKHCTECHEGDVKKGGLDLTALPWKPEERKNFDEWEKIYDRVTKGEMPPAKKSRPEAKAQSEFLASLQKPLHEFNKEQQATTGRTVLRRLNRTEYENTVHDLLGIDVPLKHILPEDSLMHGFDTVAEGLRFSQLQIEKYLEAADVALDAAIVLTQKPEPLNKRFSYKEEEGIRKNLDTPPGTITDKNNPKSGHRVMFRETPDALIMFNTADYLSGLKKCRIPGPGLYRIKLSGYAVQSDGRPITLMIYSNNYREKKLLSYCELPADKPREYEFTTVLNGSEHIVINSDDVGHDKRGQNVYNVQAKDFTGTGVAMQWLEVEGPLGVDMWPQPSLKLAMGDVPLKTLPPYKRKDRFGKSIGFEFAPADAKAAISAGISQFATRAFRRPLEAGETDRFVKLATDSLDAGQMFEDAMRVGLRAILTAPQFLLFEERPGKLDDFAVASRLSYFLWSSMPDAELMQLAAAKKLTQPAILRAQVERMLKSGKAQAFTTNFVGQWLDMRGIDATMPDKKLYPEFDMVLKLSMVAETEAFFNEVLTKNLPVSSFIDSDFAMVNSRLAEHYGIDGVQGEQFRRVSLPPDSPRGGVLTQASVLKVTANGTVTSPVLRGAWVLKRLLNQPPSPPPPSVGSIEPDTRGTTTIRDQLAKHRDSESCAGCHQNIDPPGFALESFDVIGGWRETYRSQDKGTNTKRKLKGQNIWQYKEGLPVDSSGELPDGHKFTGIKDFKKLLLSQQDLVLSALASKLMIYGTGAGIQFADHTAIDAIVKQTKAEGGGLRTLVQAVVASPMFLSK
ncbi:MAG: DUF1592 domain-containing protein [Prosthecobacter sp.]|uniref:DUF1592 domain-containing protein n=1 Tax=Prosthecobacter sp. TaxID=1965333 RepID=UPI0039027C76